MTEIINHEDRELRPPLGEQRDGYAFISYKREEVEKAKTIRMALLDSGIVVWWDEDIQCGQAWNDVLDDAVKRASCIIVLWSRRAMQSRWVMHEASSAIDRGVYTPVRIELCTIDPPYNRLQATDIVEWDGRTHHPGFLDLLQRVNNLLPIRQSFPIRIAQWCRANLITIASVLFASIALGILSWQTIATRSQMVQMDTLFLRVEEESKISTKMVRSINRTISHIESITGTIWLTIPHDHDIVVSYHKRMKKAVDKFLANQGGNHEMYVSQSESNNDGSSTPEVVAIPDDSKVFPQPNEQPIERLLSLGLSVSVYQSQIDVKDFIATRWSGAGQPDLQLSLHTQSPELNVDLKDYSIELFSELITDKQFWDTNGRITSISDLVGSQLWFYVDRPAGFGSQPDSDLNSLLEESTKAVEVRTVILTINGINFWFRAEQLLQFKTKDGIPVWMVTLPSDIEALYEKHVY